MTRQRRQHLGSKTYLVEIASVKGNAIVEVQAHNASQAKAAADRLYMKDGWYAVRANAKRT